MSLWDQPPKAEEGDQIVNFANGTNSYYASLISPVTIAYFYRACTVDKGGGIWLCHKI